MAQSLECNCCRCELNKALTYELSDGAFPIYNYKGVQEFNVLDVDRFGGAVLVDHLNPDTLVFKQRPLQGRYCPSGTGVRPLTAPYSSYLEYDEVFKQVSMPENIPSTEEQVSYYTKVYGSEGVPEQVVSELVEETTPKGEVARSVDILEGSHLTYCSVDPICVDGYLGNLYYTTGTLQNDLCISALVDPSKMFSDKYIECEEWKDFLWASRRVSTCHPELVAGVRLPAPAREVNSVSVHGRRMVVVKCMHHCLLYEDTLPIPQFTEEYTTQVQEDFISDGFMYDLQPLRNLFLVQCHCQVSAVTGNPYHFGEAVVVMETGEVRLCMSETDKSIVVRSAIGEVERAGSPHWWGCGYASHPKQLILAEQASLGIVDMRTPDAISFILHDPASQWTMNDIISAMKPHPINPMQCLVATSNSLLVVDIRRKQEPVLCVSHEMEEDPCYLDVMMNRDTLVSSVLISNRKSETTIVNFTGGCGWLGGEVAPPHFTTLPHTLNGHSLLKSKLHPLFGCGRVSHNALSTGSCFGHCYGNIMSSLEMSVYGDLFLEEWSYMGEEGGYNETSRTGRLLVEEWCREVDSLEKKTLMREGHSRPRAPLHNWKMLNQYVAAVDSPNDVCLNCFTYCKGTGADISQVSSRAANKKEGRCCLCSKVMVRGVGDDDGEQPSLTDVLKIEELESKLSDSDLGKRLMEQWQLTQSPPEGNTETTSHPQSSQDPQSTQERLIHKLLNL